MLPLRTIAKLLAVLTATAPTAVQAANLTFVIPLTSALTNPSALPPSTHATLHASGTPLTAQLTRRNTFEFYDVPPGSYLLTVHCRDFSFESERVDVTTVAVGEDGEALADAGGQKEKIEVWQTFRGNEWDNKGEQRGKGIGKAVAEVRAVGAKAYYQEKGGFSPLAFLKSPMILMALFSLGIIVGLPYIMDNMDPETRAEFEQMQKEGPLGTGGNPAAQIQNFDLAGWMAGKGGGASGSTTPTTTHTQSGGSKKKR
jgi:hypothetical protein